MVSLQFPSHQLLPSELLGPTIWAALYLGWKSQNSLKIKSPAVWPAVLETMPPTAVHMLATQGKRSGTVGAYKALLVPSTPAGQARGLRTEDAQCKSKEWLFESSTPHFNKAETHSWMLHNMLEYFLQMHLQKLCGCKADLFVPSKHSKWQNHFSDTYERLQNSQGIEGWC